MDLLKIILQHHDDYSMSSVFADNEEARTEAFVKAEGIRELITRIKHAMPDNQSKELVIGAISDHLESMAKMIFYKRNIEKD
jgi:oligoribonuclease (3'-5' exoribonuclease)